jgi:hypothetical protein
MSVEQWWYDTDREKPKYLEKHLSQCHFVQQIPTIGLESNPGFCCDRLAPDHQSHGTASNDKTQEEMFLRYVQQEYCV